MHEGSDATVAVVRKKDVLRIKVNNFYALGNTNAAMNERMQAHLPLIIHPEPKRVFFLGLGTGITAGGALQIEEIEHVTVAELLPSVIDAARDFFGPWLNGLFDDDRVRIVAEDGRNFLTATRDTYDVIVADLFMPWRIGVGGLYTVEHYAASLEKLEPGGIYAQWLPLYQLTEEEFASIANSMRKAFPKVTVWRGDFLTSKPIACLIGHRDSKPLDWKAFQKRSIALNKKLGINQVGPLKSLPGHLTHYAGNLTQAEAIYSDARLNTDDFPLIEYQAPITHRAEKAGEVDRFTRERLLAFFDKLQKAVPYQKDPWLESVPQPFWQIIDAGHLLHELKLAEAKKDRKAGEQVFGKFRSVMLRLEKIEVID